MVFPLYKFLKGTDKVTCEQTKKEEGVDVRINYSMMSNKMKIDLGKYMHAQEIKRYRQKHPAKTRYFLNPMRPGVRLTK